MTHRNADQYVVRFPDGLRSEIKAAAKSNGRSLNAEIVSRIMAAPAMSLRDWLAGQALAGMCAFHGTYGEGNDPWNNAARAYEQADAMLAARESTP
jgi:hypothetical protein